MNVSYAILVDIKELLANACEKKFSLLFSILSHSLHHFHHITSFMRVINQENFLNIPCVHRKRNLI